MLAFSFTQSAHHYQGCQKCVKDVFQHIQINYYNQLGVIKFSSWVSRGVRCHTPDTHIDKLVNKCLVLMTPLVFNIVKGKCHA